MERFVEQSVHLVVAGQAQTLRVPILVLWIDCRHNIVPEDGTGIFICAASSTEQQELDEFTFGRLVRRRLRTLTGARWILFENGAQLIRFSAGDDEEGWMCLKILRGRHSLAALYHCSHLHVSRVELSSRDRPYDTGTCCND